MSRFRLFPQVLVFLLFMFFLSPVLSAHPGHDSVQEIGESSSEFLRELDEEQRSKARLSMEDPVRTDWSFYPGKDHPGISLGELKPAQRKKVHQLLQSSLSTAGYLKVNHILHIEDILSRIQEDEEGEDPGDNSSDLYFTAIFGEPSTHAWGYRFEGHHLSLNYTFHDGELASVTPAFFGSDPAVVPHGPYAGMETLGRERSLALTLVRSLKETVRKKAIFRSEAFEDIVTERQEKVEELEKKGVPMSKMSHRNREVLKELIRVYTGNFRPEQEEKLTSSFLEAGADQLYFGWAGGLRRNKPHYYRIQTPDLLIEYDHLREGNHIHTVIRSYDGDFGRDVLAEHYENSPHHEEK